MDITINGTIERESLETLVRDVLNDESYMTHDGVDDQIEEYLHDHDFITSNDYTILDEDDVERLIDKALDEYSPEDHLISSILDEADVASMIDDKLEALDLGELDAPRLAELERRFELYANRVDQDRKDLNDLSMDAHEADNRIGTAYAMLGVQKVGIEALQANHDDLLQFQKAQVSDIKALEQRLDAALNDDHERRIQTLEERTQQAVVEGLLGRIEELERKLEASVIVDGSVVDMLVKRTEVLESSVMKLVQAQAKPVTHEDKAGLFYSLVKQAFDLLRS